MDTNHDQDGSEEVAFRPPNVQTKTMLDIGARSMFTPEQDMFRESVRKFMTDTLAPQQVREGREEQVPVCPGILREGGRAHQGGLAGHGDPGAATLHSPLTCDPQGPDWSIHPCGGGGYRWNIHR